MAPITGSSPRRRDRGGCKISLSYFLAFCIILLQAVHYYLTSDLLLLSAEHANLSSSSNSNSNGNRGPDSSFFGSNSSSASGVIAKTNNINNNMNTINMNRALEDKVSRLETLVTSQNQQLKTLSKSLQQQHFPILLPSSETGNNTKGGSPVSVSASALTRIAFLERSLNSAAVKKTENHQQSINHQLSSHKVAIRKETKQKNDEKWRNEIAQLRQEFYTLLVQNQNHKVEELLQDVESGNIYVNPLFQYNTTFCLPWQVNSDEWWTHNVDWFVTQEDDKKYCFSPDKTSMKAAIFRQLYDIQFRGDCNQVRTKRMWSNGYGADMANVMDGLIKAMETKQPMQMSDKSWHYASKKDGSMAVCPDKNMKCYFLPLSRCHPDPSKQFQGDFYSGRQPPFRIQQNRWYLEYATRPQTWLRKAVYDFSKTSIHLSDDHPCTVMHVRRADVVLHDRFSRRYMAIEEYMNATDKITENIFLLTDDDNAIKEARAKYPDHNWVVIDRPRFKGKEGGWENQIPSDDPKLEVIVILSIFRTVGKCIGFVHGRSNLSDYIAGVMMNARGKGFFNVDLNKDLDKAYNPKHADTHVISRSDWR
jgi:hypothetical protein